MDIPESNFERLSKVSIDRERISIWMLYEYDNQCNIEFTSANLLRLGSNRINPCVSR